MCFAPKPIKSSTRTLSPSFFPFPFPFSRSRNDLPSPFSSPWRREETFRREKVETEFNRGLAVSSFDYSFLIWTLGETVHGPLNRRGTKGHVYCRGATGNRPVPTPRPASSRIAYQTILSFFSFFFIFNSTRINDRRERKDESQKNGIIGRSGRRSPLFSYCNIRDFSFRFLHSCGQSLAVVLKGGSRKRTASTVFLWRFHSGRREKFPRECFAGIWSSFPSIRVIDINFTDKLWARG